MLSARDIAVIVATTIVCTAVISLVAALALRANRRGSVASQFAIVVTAAVASIVASILAVMVEMFISPHDLTVLAWVTGIATVISLTVTWVITSRAVAYSVGRLSMSARRIADGDVVAPDEPGWREFNALHAQLVATSVDLARSHAEVERLDTARRQFFAWISHDLRTPLAGIRAMSEAIDEGYSPDPEGYVRSIRSRVDALGGMVDDLFALSKLQSGSLQLKREFVPLLDVISDAVIDVQAAADARRIRILPRDVDGHVLWADPQELTRAIGNLLANGIRHAPENTDIVVSAHHPDHDRLIISVLDHGPGVTTEDISQMFDVGWRANAARTADGPSSTGSGAGFGLAIVRGIVEAHGGDVGAQHVPEGFELSITLPTGPEATTTRDVSPPERRPSRAH